MLFLLLICVFGQTESIQPRSVNLALDTVLEFNDKETDLQIIDNVEKFLGKIKNVLKDKSGRRSMAKDFKFTDYLITFFEMINKYDDDDLEDVITVIDDEIRKYHYAGCKFFELLQNNDMRKFVGRKLNQIKDKTPDDLRNDIETVIDALKTEEEGIKEFLDYINSLYPKESRDKLKNFLNNIELYKSKSKRANLDLIKIIREGLRNAIFDHYTNLNVNARKDFKIRLETFWKNFMDPFRQGHKVWNIRYTEFDKRGKDKTTKATSPVNREFNELTNRHEDGNNQFNTIKYFDNSITTKPTEVMEVKFDSKDLLRVEFPKIHIKDTTENPKDNSELNYSTIKDLMPQIDVPRKEKLKTIDKSIFGKLKDTSKDVVKEFEKTINLNLPDIPKMVKEKFDSITKDRLKIKEVKDSSATDTKDETTKKPHEKVKKPKKDKIKHKKAKRFSVITESTTDKFYDSEEIYNMNDRKTTEHTKKKRKDKTKRKHKNTKSTARSRFMTLYVEEYTGKVKTRDKTAKNNQHSWKDKTKKGRSKDKKYKTKGYSDTDSDEYNKKATKAKRYKARQEKPTKHHKKSKKHSKRSETTKKSRKWLRLPQESYEGISIESFETKSFRKNIDFDEFQNRTANIQNITKASTILNTGKERIESRTTTELSTFGTLDFWPGTDLQKSSSQTFLSSTKAVENDTTASLPLLNNNTFAKGERISTNGTLRLIDLKVNDFEISTKLPTTKNVKLKAGNTSTSIKTTKTTQKLKVTTKKTKPALMIRRSIGTSVKNKITTAKKTTIATKITNSTISTNATKPTFNLGEYLNQSEILNTADKEKKDKIQEKILKDMQLIFSPTSTTTKATNAFTDPFDEIDKALDL